MNKKIDKAVLSCSGGLDSSCLLVKLLAEGKSVRCYSFDYGQKHRIELEKIKNNIEFLKSKGLPVEHQIINVTDIFSGNTSSLVASTGKDIPHGHYAAENMKSTVVPLRNVIFSAIIYSKAINWAVETDSKVLISLGIHGGDHAIYPDCRPESQEACRKAFEVSDWNSDKVDYEAPFINIDKGLVLGQGLAAMEKLGWTEEEIMEFLRNTHTCYDPDENGRSCGKCGSCTERLEAFAFNGMKDPVEYQTDTDKQEDEIDYEKLNREAAEILKMVANFFKEFDLAPVSKDLFLKDDALGFWKDILKAQLKDE